MTGKMKEKSSSRPKLRTMEEPNTSSKIISKDAMETITLRLSSFENLYFPRSLQSSTSTPSLRQSLLLDLLSRDVAVFLERYGAQLTAEELGEFDACGDYEINWHLKSLRKKKSTSQEEVKSREVKVKNRRLAYLERLVTEGAYFSEEAMREREPYLHHEFVGKFQDMSGRAMARPGERWSDTLLRRCEEAVLVGKIREEQIRLGVDRSEWVGNEATPMEEEEDEEEEEEEDEDEVDEGNGVKKSHDEIADLPNGAEPSREHHGAGATISEEEKEDMMNHFIYIMQQKFLAGEDHQHLDYTKIDEDETLDDHWFREANYDAEEKYFAEDDESDGKYFSEEDDKDNDGLRGVH